MESKFSENLKLARKVRGYRQKEVAKMINMSNSTYCLYESGDREPNLATIEKLAHSLYISIDELFGLYDFGTENLIKEASEAYHTRPSCKCSEYYELPDGEHAELINGELYYMGAPSRKHQELVGELYYALTSYIKSKKGSCKVYSAPFAVKLSEEDNTIVQPDISVICDTDKLDDRGCNGSPNLIIEILSASNKKRDYIEKLKLYADHGVEEYWIIDPDTEKVIVYQLLNSNTLPNIYGFNNSIKVTIFEELYIQIDELL